MKRQILLGAALLATLSVFSQKPSTKNLKATGVDRWAEEKAIAENAAYQTKVSPMVGSGVLLPSPSAKPASPTTANWFLIGGSMNINGMTGQNMRPLNYNPALNAVSFIHRKSATYSVSPSIPSVAESGVVLAEISSDGGNTFDSTAIWSNATQWGRYPQGGIYNPPGNTNIANAYVVGMGETVDATTFSGVWYASKKLNVLNNVAGAGPGEQQFFSHELNNASLYPANMQRHAWTISGFSATNDGIIRGLGLLGNSLGGSQERRGYAVVTGTFNGTSFDWKMDSIIPPAVVQTNGFTKALNNGQMVWNPAGTIGYVVGIGVLNGATRANRSMQPIIYKMDRTTSSTATWSLMPSLDFNTTFTTVLNHLPLRTVTYPTLDSTELPAINDFDIAIDENNDLHIGAVFMSGFSTHPDSLAFYTTFGSAINAGESYRWQHLPGQRPYIYDFIGNGVNPWKMLTIDSASSESPGFATTQAGFNENPWDNGGPNGQKPTIEYRLQMGRTPDGKFISFSWAESDTLYTSSGFKYNTLPDVKSRLMAISSGSAPYVLDNGPENNVTGNDNNVRTRATLHFMSPMTGPGIITPGSGNSFTVDVMTPFTVTNSNPYSQTTNNGTWYGKTKVSYAFGTQTVVGIAENNFMLANTSIYPNPAKGQAKIKMILEKNSSLDIKVLNAVGQVVKQSQASGQFGENNIGLDLTGLNAGIYFVNIKADNSSVTKKLIVE